ncbi:glycosyltransferase [Winogradskyella immobilis]|uniref:Glycosyltransferase family 4 protein n=1 Tax=Winogradskyella immobilis TaxID=2816852 RepID=A0ABS8ENS4_9FLAO|nr:glycosyltransferase [Winogradskyella immobilis]MCC1484884.1 glycosyltransferase family 4 protein [Winogradskyella immobilis]MCG0016976.1 glycosyltransferase [Winogradskyella immobilis]
MKLCIISHTEHYKTHEGYIVGWGPTVGEINHLTSVFDEIYHVAMLHKGEAPPSALPYRSSKIKFIELPALGGQTFGAKLSTVWNAPKVISVVNKTLRKVDYFQLRTPTGIGVFLIPYLTLFVKNKGWYKYAGNWNQENPPLGYRLQRTMLNRQKRKVTINGNWPNQADHCITFENPCLTQADIKSGTSIIVTKTIKDKFNFCYVGRLERPKGVERIIKGVIGLSSEVQKRIGTIHLVGDGAEKEAFINMAKETKVDIQFHGFLSRHKVFEIYKKSHFFLMPTTASEGFPKVIAEAYNFGCIPIVSDVSAISQYVKHKFNGFIVTPVTSEGVTRQLNEILELASVDYQLLLKERTTFVEPFSYEHYNNRIMNIILNLKSVN